MLDLLSDPIIGVRRSGRVLDHLSLPETFAALARNGVEAFPALRPHQAPAWHVFLVQVAALALVGAGRAEPPDTPADWAALLRDLAGADADTAWSLVVADWTRPALLQSPLPDRRLIADYKSVSETPDALDLLVTSKNHDLKAERFAVPSPELWLYALVTLQTFEGVMGAGKYGISRMNGGYGSRPMFGVEPAGGPGARFARDVTRLIAVRPDRFERVPGLGTWRRLGLLWLEPWDGATQFALQELDPFYVEICRRVRLIERDGRVVALGCGSKAARVAAPKELNGVTGDPWAPVDLGESKQGKRSDPKVLSITSDGFSYRRITALLDRGQFERPPLAEIDQADAAQDLILHAAALARGQGKTEGFHERRIPVSKTISRLFGTDATDRLAELAKARVTEIGDFSRRALRPALFLLFQGGPDAIEYGKTTTSGQVEPWMQAFDAEIDRVFFDHLFPALQARATGDAPGEEAAHKKWREEVLRLGWQTLDRATEAAPRTAMHWHRARARSRSYFRAQAARLLSLTVHEAPDDRPDSAA